MSHWVESTYGIKGMLVFGRDLIYSCTGFMQGDPLASLLFAIAAFPVMASISAALPDLRANVWLHDDGTCIGRKEDALQVLQIIRLEGPPRGLFLSEGLQGKTAIWNPFVPAGALSSFSKQIKIAPAEGIVLLGSPIGNTLFKAEEINSRVDKIEGLVEKLCLLEDSHIEYCLLRSCLAIPKMSYTLRTTDPSLIEHILRRFDNCIRGALENILGTPLTDNQWIQSSLPVSMTGMGLRSAVDHGPGAFLSSVAESSTLVESITKDNVKFSLAAAFAMLRLKSDDQFSLDDASSVKQREISFKIDSRIHDELLSSTSDLRDKARLNSLSLDKAGAWLTVIPSKTLGLHLAPKEFRVSARYRLGLPVFSTKGPCVACKKQESDQLADHAIACGMEGERIGRHNRLRDLLFQVSSQAALSPVREERALLPGRDSRPADVLLPSWFQGLDTALDVTVVSPLQQALVAKAAEHPGAALTHAYERKNRQSFEDCKTQGIHFQPLPVETLGGWHTQAVSVIKKLGRQLARQTGKEDSEVIAHTFQRLSILLMKGNSALILNRVPSHPPPHIDGEKDY